MSDPKDRDGPARAPNRAKSDDRSGPARGRSRRFWTATLEIDPETSGYKIVLPCDLSKAKLLRIAEAFRQAEAFARWEATTAPAVPPLRVLIRHPDGSTSKLSSPNHRPRHLPKK